MLSHFLFVSLHKNNKQMEEHNNIEHIIDGLDESCKSVDEYGKTSEELNKILDELLKTTAVPKEYECRFDYHWMTKQSWWNNASGQRFTEQMEEISKFIYEESKKMSVWKHTTITFLWRKKSMIWKLSGFKNG